ncbi:MAG: response regulator [Planctomycetes bacterium]|nr:response regulator [Planctomycetota bacterium]
MAKRVLLCDDEPHILRAAEFKFSRSGYEVMTAGDGEEALEILRVYQPQVIVTDCQMPRMGGLELAARVRANPATAGIPIIMLTAKRFELTREETCDRHGIVTVLAKPFSPRDLFARVEALIAEGLGCEAAETEAGEGVPAEAL